MDQQQQFETTIEAVASRIQDEVSDLLGSDFSVSGRTGEIVSQKSFLDQLRGKQIKVQIDIEGDKEHKGYLLIGIKDAIRLGGTLIMLPAAELEEVIGREEYSEEIEDSFGEIANIIAGSLTKGFEDSYVEKFRFTRENLEVFSLSKLGNDTEVLLVNQTYYQICNSMVLDDQPMGEMVILLPAKAFNLVSGDDESQQVESGDDGASATGILKEEVDESDGNQQSDRSEKTVSGGRESAGELEQSEREIRKPSALVDKMLTMACDQVIEEVSALLGTEITLEAVGNIFVTKEDFFSREVSGNQVIADFEVQGGEQGESYLVASLESAIRIGGQLIMLPGAELESALSTEDFDEDISDAFGEVSNIIAGVYTDIFEKHYSRELRFEKNSLQRVTPGDGIGDSNEPIVNQEYCLSKITLSYAEGQTEILYFLIPGELLQPIGEKPSGDDDPAETDYGNNVQNESYLGDGDLSEDLDLLLISDSEGEGARLEEIIRKMGYSCRILGFKDNLHTYLPGKLKAIYLVMKDVNEQAFGAAIKVSTACSVPIIAVGPGWTRSKVIKAVKYGVHDILLVPASDKEIEDNVAANVLQLAA